MTTTTKTPTPRPRPRAVRREDYRAPAFLVDTVALELELDPEVTTVRARLAVRRNPDLEDAGAALELDGVELEHVSVAVDGAPVPAGRLRVEPERLLIEGLGASAVVETVVRIRPSANTALEGLYVSSGNFCTQCEAQGFRRITWWPDRPDVMALFTTTIVADRERYPVLLSNGNKVAESTRADDRHQVTWEDPFAKPCYLFALVAGDLHRHAGSFTTRSGREVTLEILVEPRNADKCAHALRSLQQAMDWDERVFGLEYDLDVYMIVAVDDFNMGAMENKGLNIFNSKYVLARPDTATDDDFEAIQGVVAHEYFHNWTGNRVTCRDWFQLSLKEGLTVFRDQLFSEDMTSRAVKRISDVRILRTVQFAEDAGPTAHPVRPEQYIEMNNFYTVTVYNKGAEVVRMYRTLLGEQGFRRGMDLYFERHDGQAVTCEDFCRAMEDANGADLTQFRRWYSQAGTPTLTVRGSFDATAGTYALDVEQSCRPTPGQSVKEPFHVPLAVGLLDRSGRELFPRLAGEEAAPGATTRILEVREPAQRFVFTGLQAEPVPSVLRHFSAPVKLDFAQSRADQAFLAAHDTDDFNRWEAGQKLALEALVELAGTLRSGGKPALDPLVVEAARAVLADEGLDRSLAALALVLPGEDWINEQLPIFDVTAVHRAREHARAEIARALRSELEAAYESNQDGGPFREDAEAIGRRRLKNVALGYLACTGERAGIERAARQFREAANMTDSLAALRCLADHDGPERREALAAFHDRWKADPLVMDKWLAIQAASTLPGTLGEVERLLAHPVFSMKNPNKVRALIGTFAAANPVGFHDVGGGGYRFVADRILELDRTNPHVAARLVKPFTRWRRFDGKRQELLQRELERMAAVPELSRDVYEMVSLSLADPSA